MANLAKANRYRLRRAEIHRQVWRAPDPAESLRRAIEVLLDREEAVESLRLGVLLSWVRRFGDVRTRKLLTRLRLTETKPIGALTDRQVGLLVAELRETEERTRGDAPSGASSAP